MAKLPSPVAGAVTIMTWSDGEQVDTQIVTDLYHVSEDGPSTNHLWKLYVTDVLDSKAGIKSSEDLVIKKKKIFYLQLIYSFF